MFLKLKNVDVFFLYINIYFRTLIDRHTKALRFIRRVFLFEVPTAVFPRPGYRFGKKFLCRRVFRKKI